ncbi:MAG: electron transport complex subunit RsxD [Candidatus Dactylopiibacterium carminicum]|uniref:Ion-translocating oxidoreductase complex subunit D n=1 Tax=Candidatus Dactylopiibacterium carminicum TaxID=857335 RepID=A0A272EWR3_9RHOO|nr:RnfABCDGE type electron transport complex subunit D [Candidatus Dactylopiibacterium carminicum]KAF7598177.1 electron transport complex subunit RsxD [Candidatus Dactylopiibacterium carminicum]PAS94100.1 MAG: electron transport complex subunit RsxD [Candidatus Dactylopiibacterium carminicum]PAS96864.1 MAG: electron transport complex subunit RsxD [Candidatus Dactylopiibacterium carminicum]
MLNNSPYVRRPASVTRVMGTVLAALVPAIGAYVWQFGPAILGQLLLATLTALACEAAMLAARGKPLRLFLTDLSVVVTAWLIALAFPATAPWWLVVSGTAIAVVVAKHLYGGLGQNTFNPAMVAYAVMLVAFPALMSQWPSALPDAITSATPLDALRTGLREAGASVASVRADGSVFGSLAGRGWEWLALAYLIGGLLLIQQRIITWHIPVGFILALAAISGAFWLADSARYASPVFHLAAGGSMLGAFFIFTDPVSASTTPRGKLIYAAAAALLVYLIRVFGAYPDGVAFATLLMNILVPLIDMKTQPPVFGHKGDNKV